MANNDLVGAVVKAMALVKIVASAPDGMKLNELAQSAGLKNVTCFNLARTLVAGGFLDKINGKFYTGYEISNLADSRYHSRFFQQAENALLTLNRSWPKATVIFAVPGMYGMEQTHRIAFEHPGVIQRLNREALPPYASAAGLLGLAFIRDEDAMLRIAEKYPFAEFGIPLWGNKEKMEHFLMKCRKEKIAISPFDAEVFRRVSVPIFDKSEKLIAVIGESCPVRDFTKKDFEQVCRDLVSAAVMIQG